MNTLSNLPVGVIQWANKVGFSIGINPAEAIDLMVNTSPKFSDFLDQYSEARVNYWDRISVGNLFQLSTYVSLSGESHLNGSFVLLDPNSETVFYSSTRSNPSIFYELCSWYCEELGLPVFSRPIIIDSDKLIGKPYINKDPITDVDKASELSGYVLALAWFTSTTDLHSANVIFSNNVPIIIDDECVLHPLRENQFSKLENHRRHYPFSPYRTILFQENVMGDRKAKSGFYDLLSIGLNIDLFSNALIKGFNFLKNRKKSILDIVIKASKRQASIRYLMRGTEFYDTCIAFVGMQSFKGESKQSIRTSLISMFKTELNFFPETACFMPHEIECILKGEVPYFSAMISDGVIRPGTTGSVLGYIPCPLNWLLKNMEYISFWNEKQLRHAISLGFNQSEYHRKKLPVFI